MRTHPFAGSNSERQRVGDPGHCERCAEVGHVRAHPPLGCGDVGCYKAHGPRDEPPRERDITDTVLAAQAGTVVLGRRGMLAGSVWVVIDGYRLGPEGADGAPRLVCVHSPAINTASPVRTEGQLRELRMLARDWRIAPASDAVRGTPARLNG